MLNESQFFLAAARGGANQLGAGSLIQRERKAKHYVKAFRLACRTTALTMMIMMTMFTMMPMMSIVHDDHDAMMSMATMMTNLQCNLQCHDLEMLGAAKAFALALASALALAWKALVLEMLGALKAFAVACRTTDH